MRDSYLNIENIENSTEERELHPLKPCVDKNTKVLFLGSFPPQRKRWAKGFDFFYPNYINDHWRLMGFIFFDDKDFFVDLDKKTYKYRDVVNFVEEKGLGYYDTSEEVKRLKNNASDKFLEVLVKTNIKKLLSKTQDCRLIVTTGEKATDNICEEFGIVEKPKVGKSVVIPNLLNNNGNPVSLYRLPSSSRAYPMKLEKKAEFYRAMLEYAEIL